MASYSVEFNTASSNPANGSVCTWSNPSNALTSNNSRASSGLIDDPSGATEYLEVLTPYYLGAPLVLGPWERIVGIVVTIERMEQWPVIIGDVKDVEVLVIGGSDNKADLVTNWPMGPTDVNKTYGSPTDTWGGTWTNGQDLSTFGVRLSITASMTDPLTVGQGYVDSITAVIYTEVSGGGGSPPLSGKRKRRDQVRLVVAGEATASKRRVYFDLRDVTDAITAETGEAGGQPQISVDGAAWTNTGIGTLSHIGNGRYYADLTQAVCLVGSQIETRYKSANTLESPGDSVQVVAPDIYLTTRFPTAAEVQTAVWSQAEYGDTAGRPTTVIGQIGHTFRYLYNKNEQVQDTGAQTVYKDDSVTVLVAGTNAASSTSQTHGKLS